MAQPEGTKKQQAKIAQRLRILKANAVMEESTQVKDSKSKSKSRRGSKC